MHKLRTVMLLILATAVILGCSMLPGIAASLTDRVNQNTPAFAPMEAISFVPREPATDTTDTLEYYLSRLALHGNMYGMPVNAEVAVMTEEEVLAAAREQMRAYESLGVLQPFENNNTYVEPYFAIAVNDVDNTAVYWTVYSNTNKDPSDSLLVYLDDATGKIMSIDFESTEGIYQDCTIDERRILIEQLAMTFLGQFAPENETLASRIHEVNEVETGKDITSYEYILSGYEENQIQYIIIHITLYERGFQIRCSLS